MTFVKIGVSTKRMNYYTPLAHRRQTELLGGCAAARRPRITRGASPVRRRRRVHVRPHRCTHRHPCVVN
jgi:hypothetical protein